MSEKTIKIVQGGGTPTEVKTNAKTWGDFKREIKNDISLPDAHVAMLGETVSVLIDESHLPDTVTAEGVETNVYHIFITPKKSKSGADFKEASYKECRAEIKKLKLSNEKAAKFFGNYTHMTTKELQKILTKWYKKNSPAKEEKVIKTKTSKVGKVRKVVREEVIVEKSLTIETSSDAISVLENIIAFLKTSHTGSKVIFTMNEVSEKDYKKFERMSR